MQSPLNGIELPERKFIVHRFGVKGNNPYGLGLGSKLFWPVLFKREGVAFWLTYLEKYAAPTPVGKYPAGLLPEEQRKLLTSLEGLRHSGAVVVPLGTDVSFLQASMTGSVQYQDWCKYWDMEMALCVFGSNLGTQVDGQGARAATETHKDTEEQIIDADADLLSDTLRKTLFQWLTDYNFPGAGVPTLRRIRATNELAHEDLRATRVANMKSELDLLFETGGRFPAAEFAKIAAALAGIDLLPHVPTAVLRQLAPHMAASRERLEAAASQGTLPMPANANDPAAKAVRAIAFADDDRTHDHGLDLIADQMDTAMQPMMEQWLSRIKAQIDDGIASGEDLTAFADRLAALDSELTLDGLGNMMALGVEVSELTGRADVSDMVKAKSRSSKFGRRKK
jgi:phage gp29-like protein